MRKIRREQNERADRGPLSRQRMLRKTNLPSLQLSNKNGKKLIGKNDNKEEGNLEEMKRIALTWVYGFNS